MPSKEYKTCSEKPNGLGQKRSEKPNGRYGRTPDSVLLDRSLSPVARCVFAFLARSAVKTCKVSLGQRLISDQLGFHLSTVNKAIGELITAKHVESTTTRNGGRTIYTLTSPLFGAGPVRASGGELEGELEPKPKPASAPTLSCPRCHKRCGALLKVGWCRSCNWELKVRKITRDEMSKSA